MKAIQKLLDITQKLREDYGRGFTLDGNLVGDIGEVLYKEYYGLELLKSNTKIHDAEQGKKKIQIKSSFKYNFNFPYKSGHIPEYIICVNINDDGSLEEIYNGTGQFLYDEYAKYLKSGKMSAKRLQELNKQVTKKVIKIVTK